MPRLCSQNSHLAAALSLLLGAAIGLSGCSKNAPRPDGTTDAASLPADYIGLYENHRYADAMASAEYRMPKLQGHEREVAQLTAGLSAYALGKYDKATSYLQPLTSSSDRQIAGRAEATLGQIAQARGQHVYAADLLKRAATDLDGDDAARASFRAGNSLAALGKQSEATSQYQTAAKEADSEAIRKHAAAMTAPGPFALQAGIFATRANADKKAAELNQLAGKLGLGTARIVPDSLNGKPAYAVHVGKFPNRQAAVQAKSKLTAQTVIVQAE
jgi:tetratricopeptide (TPR) repeat protein